jgi:translation initiation factor 1
VPPKRSRRAARGPSSGGREAETRLVYSTSGEAPSAEPPAAPKAPRGAGSIRVRLERRASGRLVTLLTGVPGSPAEVAELARHLRTVCGAGGTAQSDGIELQGDQRDRAAAALEARGLKIKR